MHSPPPPPPPIAPAHIKRLPERGMLQQVFRIFMSAVCQHTAAAADRRWPQLTHGSTRAIHTHPAMRRSLVVRTPSRLRVHVLPSPELRPAFAAIQTGQDINVTGIWLSRGAGATRTATAAAAGGVGSHAGGHAHAALLPPALQRMQMASAWAAAGSGGNTSLVKAASVAPNALSVYCFMPSVMQLSGGKQATPRVSGERAQHAQHAQQQQQQQQLRGWLGCRSRPSSSGTCHLHGSAVPRCATLWGSGSQVPHASCRLFGFEACHAHCSVPCRSTCPLLLCPQVAVASVPVAAAAAGGPMTSAAAVMASNTLVEREVSVLFIPSESCCTWACAACWDGMACMGSPGSASAEVPPVGLVRSRPAAAVPAA